MACPWIRRCIVSFAMINSMTDRCRYGLPYHGMSGLQVGFLVAFTQLIPEHQVQLLGKIKLRVKVGSLFFTVPSDIYAPPRSPSPASTSSSPTSSSSSSALPPLYSSNSDSSSPGSTSVSSNLRLMAVCTEVIGVKRLRFNIGSRLSSGTPFPFFSY